MSNHDLTALTGYLSAVPTPFIGGRLDEAGFEAFCDWQIREGIAGLVVCGTTGEAPTLREEEQRRVVRRAVWAAGGRVPVIAGAGSNSTQHAIELARAAEAEGADGILAVVPYYNKPTQEGLYGHFAAIHEACGLPIILYDVPSRTGRELGLDTIERLARLPRVVGLKDASNDLARPARLRRSLGSRFRLLSGEDATALGYLAQGGDGCISVTSNVVPSLCARFHAAWTARNVEVAQPLFLDIVDLSTALFAETNPVPVKFALSLLGQMSPKVRLPLAEASAPTRVQVGQAMQRLGLLKRMAAPRLNGASLPLEGDPIELAYR